MTPAQLKKKVKDINEKLDVIFYEDTGNPSEITIADDDCVERIVYIFHSQHYVPGGVNKLLGDYPDSDFEKLQDLINEWWSELRVAYNSQFDEPKKMKMLKVDWLDFDGKLNSSLISIDHVTPADDNCEEVVDAHVVLASISDYKVKK